MGRPKKFTPFDDLTIPEPNSGCLIWLGPKVGNGYGEYKNSLIRKRAHVFALERKLGRPVAEGKFACHICDTPLCVEEAHLYEGTPKQNTSDSINRGRYRGGRYSRLTTEDVETIKKSKLIQRLLAEKFGVSQAVINRVRNGTQQ